MTQETNSFVFHDRPPAPVDLESGQCTISVPQKYSFGEMAMKAVAAGALCNPSPEYYEIDDGLQGYRRRTAVNEALDSGIMLGLAHGWSFIFDHRPPGQEGNYIPAGEYTRYFSQRQIPMAAPDHELHAHDRAHVPGYQDMFRSRIFGDVVQGAATNALVAPETCDVFTTAIDRLGDMKTLLDRTVEFSEAPSAYAIRVSERSLRTLIGLYTQKLPFNHERDDMLLETLISELGIQYHRTRLEWFRAAGHGLDIAAAQPGDRFSRAIQATLSNEEAQNQ